MKRLLPLLMFVALFTTNAFAQNLENPGDYMSAITNAHVQMNSSYMSYMSAAAHGRRARKIEKMRQQVLESITNSRYKTIEIPMYKGDNSLRQSSIDYIKLCFDVFNEDYSRIVNMEEIVEQSFDQMQAYLLMQEKASDKIREAGEKIEKAQEAFAAKYNVKITNVKDELNEKMAVAGDLTHYKNQIYLLFFKCNWQDSQLSDAIAKKKVNDIEQARSALLKYATEGLAALDTMRAFRGDNSYLATCRQALKFYKSVAENDVPKMTDFYLKEENFAKMKKSFEAKSANRSKEDVDNFNKSVADINAAVAKFNSTTNDLNSKRSQVIKDWNETESRFFDMHMPHYKG